MKIFNKKNKGNALLAALVMCSSLLMLCTFGTDATYIILSRYKLQKVTEAMAFEYAALKAREISANYATTDAAQAASGSTCTNIGKKYEKLYNTLGSGVISFDVESIDFAYSKAENVAAAKVSVTSKVMPLFLRFLGVQEVLIHAVANASTGRVTVSKTINGVSAGSTIDENNSYVEFADEIPTVTAKNTDMGDFKIKFEYADSSSPESKKGGGYFVLGGYKVKDNQILWTDLGGRALNDSVINKVCIDSSGNWGNSSSSVGSNRNCFACINAAKEREMAFNLAKKYTDEEGRTNRFQYLRVYKTGGTGEKMSSGAYANPCDLSFEPDETMMPEIKYVRRDANVTLTVLNQVRLIRNKDFSEFASKAGVTKGSCTGI